LSYASMSNDAERRLRYTLCESLVWYSFLSRPAFFLISLLVSSRRCFSILAVSCLYWMDRFHAKHLDVFLNTQMIWYAQLFPYICMVFSPLIVYSYRAPIHPSDRKKKENSSPFI
jgi:hypothetical protein